MTISATPAVRDTSPILNLGIVGRLSLLHEPLGEVLIPQAVADELRWDVLLRAHQEGQLPALRPVLEELATQAGFHIRSDLFARLVAFDATGPRRP